MCLNRFGAESEAPLLCFFEFFFFHYLKKKEEKEKEPTIFEVKNMETGKKKREELSRWNELEMSNSAHFVRLPHLKKKEMVSPVQFRPPGDSGTLWERRGGM